jgi:class 3 adenylate cyclase
MSSRRERGEAFGAHIGIALGEVLAGHFGSAGHAAYTVTGDAPTVATRLMEAAPDRRDLGRRCHRRRDRGRGAVPKLSPLSLKGTGFGHRARDRA